MRRWPILATLLLASPLAASMAPPEPPAPPERIALTPDTDTQWVPFDLTPGNQIRFATTIDGRPATAILDTGVSVSVLARRWVDRAGLRVTAGTQAMGVGGDVAIGWVAGRDIAIGGLMRSGGRLAVVDLPADATGGAHSVDVLVGRDLLDRYALDLDFAARRFRLLPSGRLPFAGQSAPLATLPGRQLYVSEVQVGDARLRPVIVDTGDGATLTVSDEAWRIVRPGGPAVATTTISYGVSGPVTTGLTVLPTIAVGEATLHEAEARIEPAGGFNARIGAAGRIGLGFLQHYRVLLDPRAGRMVLAPDAGAPAARRSTSGLLFSVGRDRLSVLHVMRGGPAAAGGWRAGDQICSVDGAPIDGGYAGRPIAQWPIGAPGRVVALGMCGGGTRSLTLERFY